MAGEFRDLIFEIKALNTNISAQVRQNQQGGTNRAASGGSSPAPSSREADRQSADDDLRRRAARASISAVQQVSAQAGPLGQGFSSVLGGLLSGGPVGGLIAGAGAIAGLASDFGRAAQQGALNAPLFAAPSRVAADRQFARQDFALGTLAQAQAPLEGLGVDDPFGVIAQQRQLRQQNFLATEPVDRSAKQLGSFFGNLAAAGYEASAEQIQRVGRVVLEQNTRRARTEANVQNVLTHMAGTAPILPGQ